MVENVTIQPNSSLAHRILLVLACLPWILAIAGFTYATFISNEATDPLSVMSPRVFITTIAIIAGWWVAAVIFAISLLFLIYSSHRSRPIVWSTVISGAFFLPYIVFLAYDYFVVLSR